MCDASVTESGVWSTSVLLFASSVTILNSMPCRFLVADCMIQCMQNGADTEGVHVVVVFIFSVSLLDASMCGLFCHSLWSICISFIFWCLILHFCLVCSNIHCIHTTHGAGMLFGFELRSLLSHNQQLNTHILKCLVSQSGSCTWSSGAQVYCLIVYKFANIHIVQICILQTPVILQDGFWLFADNVPVRFTGFWFRRSHWILAVLIGRSEVREAGDVLVVFLVNL